MSQGFLKMSLDYHGARYKFTSSCNYRSLKVRQSCKEEVHSQLNKIAVFLIYVLFLIVLAFFSHLSRPKKFRIGSYAAYLCLLYRTDPYCKAAQSHLKGLANRITMPSSTNAERRWGCEKCILGLFIWDPPPLHPTHRKWRGEVYTPM